MIFHSEGIFTMKVFGNLHIFPANIFLLLQPFVVALLLIFKKNDCLMNLFLDLDVIFCIFRGTEGDIDTTLMEKRDKKWLLTNSY